MEGVLTNDFAFHCSSEYHKFLARFRRRSRGSYIMGEKQLTTVALAYNEGVYVLLYYSLHRCIIYRNRRV